MVGGVERRTSYGTENPTVRKRIRYTGRIREGRKQTTYTEEIDILSRVYSEK